MHVKFDILGKAKRKHLWVSLVCCTGQGERVRYTFGNAVGGPWQLIRRESTQGAVQLQHVAVGPGFGRSSFQDDWAGEVSWEGRPRNEQPGNGVSCHGGWGVVALGLGTWGGREKRHLSSGSACTVLGRRQSRRGDLARWTDAKAVLSTLFSPNAATCSKSSGYARSLTVWWPRGLGPRTNKVWGLDAARCVGHGTEFTLAPLYAQFVTSTLDTKLRIDKGRLRVLEVSGM